MEPEKVPESGLPKAWLDWVEHLRRNPPADAGGVSRGTQRAAWRAEARVEVSALLSEMGIAVRKGDRR